VIGVGATVGNYVVSQKIGEGAMGSVFLAHHPVIGKRVALKVIHPELAANEEMIARFFNEARAVTQIGHENIVDVQDFGQTPNGDSFIVMELLEGQGLGDRMKREGALSIPRATHIAIQIADGLAAAHARGVIHRDLKPDNLFLVQRGGDPDFVKILDFGLAKLTGPGGMQHKTKTGSLLGTPHYMAPEQAEAQKNIDGRVDVYGLGCILFHMLTGRVPFPGEGFGEVLVKHLREPPPLPSRLNPQVPPALEKIVLHALAKKPEFRFSSMDEFRGALRDPDRFAKMLTASDGIRLTPDDGIPAQSLPPPPAPPRPMMMAPPPAAPPRLPENAPTVQGTAPPEVLAALAAKRKAEAAAFEVATVVRPERATVQGPIRAAAKRRIDSSDEPKSGGTGLVVGIVVAIVIIVGAGGGGLWYWKTHHAGVVAISTVPPGAEVLRGDTLLGTTPLTIPLPRGDEAITLAFRKEGFLTAQRDIAPGDDRPLSIKLLARPPSEPSEPDQAVEPVAKAPAGRAPGATGKAPPPTGKAPPPTGKAPPPTGKAPPTPTATTRPPIKTPPGKPPRKRREHHDPGDMKLLSPTF
jgi:serine/threonine-protein kinase